MTRVAEDRTGIPTVSTVHSLVGGGPLPGRERAVVNPATGENFATVTVADGPMVDAAVEYAVTAQRSWAAAPIDARVALLEQLSGILDEEAEHLARLLTLEQGKPLAEARAEVASAAATLRHHARVGAEMGSSLVEEEVDGHLRSYTPLGVVAGIIPWNYPLLIAAMKIGPALLTGNAIIVKPAPTTPLTTLEFGRLIADAVPPGLVQVLGDDGSVGPLLAGHPDIRKIAFTGSTTTGRNVMAAAAPTLKRLTLELGGNDAAIVLDDVEPEAAATGIFAAAFRNAGQVCGAVKRVYVHTDVYDRFVAMLAELVAAVTVGDGFDPAVTIGPSQNRTQFEKAMGLLSDAARAGTVLAQSASPTGGGGYFIPVTLIGDLDDTHPLVTEEQFAPLLPVLRFTDVDDAITRANSTSYGLTASVWTSDVARGEAVVSQLDAGLRCVNKHNKAAFSVGIGMSKQSGIGWLFGLEGTREYQQGHLLFR